MLILALKFCGNNCSMFELKLFAFSNPQNKPNKPKLPHCKGDSHFFVCLELALMIRNTFP